MLRISWKLLKKKTASDNSTSHCNEEILTNQSLAKALDKQKVALIFPTNESGTVASFQRADFLVRSTSNATDFSVTVNDTNFSATAKRKTTSGAFPRAYRTSRFCIYRSNYFNFCFFKNVRQPKLRSRCKSWGARSTVSTSLFPKERNKRVTNCKSKVGQHCFQTWVRKIYSRELLKMY